MKEEQSRHHDESQETSLVDHAVEIKDADEKQQNTTETDGARNSYHGETVEVIMIERGSQQSR
eukprot:m.62620 g.62620  ORF g.62620 m.62620 type:complete len:63 (+) comp13406_c0_seq1:196-384(+)